MSLFIRHKLKLGTWVSKAKDTVYIAETDGFVVVQGDGGHVGGWIKGWCESWETLRVWNGSGYVENGAGFTMPVRKGKTWRVTKSSVDRIDISWVPLI